MRWWGSRGWAESAAKPTLKTLLGERAAGVGFEVLLECQLVREGAIPNELTRLELRSVGRFSRVVVRESALQVSGCTNVFLIGKVNAADDVDIPHRCSSPSSPHCASKTRVNAL